LDEAYLKAQLRSLITTLFAVLLTQLNCDATIPS